MRSAQHPRSKHPNFLRQLARRVLAAALPRPIYLTQGPRSAGAVALTFDDGPDPERTPKVLDILAGEGVKATFFVLGRQAERYPDLVRRIEAEGHAVGHHTYSHPTPRKVSPAFMYAEVQQASRLLQELLGHPIGLYRPPHGQLRALDFVNVWALRQTIVLWNVDPRDLAQPSAEHITRWFETTHLDSGDLILLHDSCDHTVTALPSIISRARRSGLGIERLDGWIHWWAGQRSRSVAGPRPRLP